MLQDRAARAKIVLVTGRGREGSMPSTGTPPRRAGEWRSVAELRRWLEPALLVVTVALLAAGGTAWAVDADRWADGLWATATALALVPAVGWVVVALLRRAPGVDLIGVLALLGTLAVGEYLAGALIAVMLATGRALEAAAQRRATSDLRALLARAPRTARRPRRGRGDRRPGGRGRRR